MKASAELSMYPLDPDYGTSILKFIGRLRQYEDLSIHTNRMSTQIFGDYDKLMSVLSKEMKHSFVEEGTVVMVIKLLNLDLT